LPAVDAAIVLVVPGGKQLLAMTAVQSITSREAIFPDQQKLPFFGIFGYDDESEIGAGQRVAKTTKRNLG
jgi:hypothetical protein